MTGLLSESLTGDSMVDVIAGMSAFGGMIGMARALKDLNDAAVRNEAVIALTEKIIDAQARYTTLAQQVSELEAKLATYETWEREKEHYGLQEHGERRALAYALREGVEPAEPAHSICPDCYQVRKKTILQKERRSAGRQELLLCHVCGWQGTTHGHAQDSTPPKVITRRPFGR